LQRRLGARVGGIAPLDDRRGTARLHDHRRAGLVIGLGAVADEHVVEGPWLPVVRLGRGSIAQGQLAFALVVVGVNTLANLVVGLELETFQILPVLGSVGLVVIDQKTLLAGVRD